VDIGQFFQDVGIIHGGVAIRDLDAAPALDRGKHHEQVGGAIALVLVIEARWTAAFIGIGTRVSTRSCFEVSSRQTSGQSGSCGRTIVLVQDNLNIYSKPSLYEAFPPAEARRLVERFEWHYTPKHGSWLDLAESELAVLSSQCLDRRIPDKQTLIDEVAAWEQERNDNHATAD
jgi:hypothetical protein